MNTTYKLSGDTLNIYIAPNTTKKLFDPVLADIEKLHFKSVRIDLKSIFYMKSEELSNLIAVKKLAAGRNAQVFLLNLNESVYQILEMSNLLKIFNTEQDLKSYTNEELLDMFHSDDTADRASSFMADNYDKYKNTLLEGISSEDPLISEYCILTIGRVQDTNAVKYIQKALDSVYTNVVCAALQVLGWLFDDSSKEKFYSLMLSEDKDVSEAAGASLAMVSDSADVAKLKEIGNNVKPEIRSVVAKTLSLVNGKEAFDIVKEMLKKETDNDVLRNLVRGISYFNEPEATQILISFLDGSSPMPVQEAAAAGLQRTGLKGYEDEILKKVYSQDIWISYFAVKALGQNCNEKIAAELMKVYDNTEDNVRLAIIEAVSSSPSTSTPFLKKQLHNENEDIRKESLLALYKSDPLAGVTKAKELIENDPSWIVRYNALEILDKSRPEGLRSLLRGLHDENKYVQDKVNKILAGWV